MFKVGSPATHQPAFAWGNGPIYRVMYAPYLSVDSIRFWWHPVPTEAVAFPCGRGTDSRQTALGFRFSAYVRFDRGEPTVPRSRWCVPSGWINPLFTSGSAIGIRRLTDRTLYEACIDSRSLSRPVFAWPCFGCDALTVGFYLRFTPSDYSKRMGDGQEPYTLGKVG